MTARACITPGCGKPAVGLRCPACLEGKATVSPAPEAAISSGRREPNKTERRFELDHLAGEVAAGRVVRYEYEALKLRIGEKTSWLTPDWCVWLPDGRIRLDEVKGGHVEADAREKFKAAARLYPEFHWRMWQWDGKRWTLLYDYPAAVAA